MHFLLKGKVIMVTGAGSGIGAATAVELHRRGAIVVLLDCDRQGLERIRSELGSNVSIHVMDVTRMEDCESAVARTLAVQGQIDMVWANAGIAAFGPLAHTDPLAWKRCLEVNVFGVFNMVRAALAEVIRNQGYVLVTASVSSFAHPPAVSAYAASKAAVEAMCNAWRIELAHHGVGVGIIHASWVKTPLMTEGQLHPAFVRLRAATPAFLNGETSVQDAARMIADGIARRQRQIWVPGWVRFLHWVRVLLHTAPAERELLKAAPDIERLFLEGIQASGVSASSMPPREFERMRKQTDNAQD